MFGKKLVSDSLLAAVKGVTSGEQIDSSGSELLVGDAVQVQEGPHAGKTGTISSFQNTGRSEVQLNHGPSVALYNETLLNEEDADGTKPKWTDNHKGLYTPKQHKDRLERLRKHKESSKSTPKLRKGSKLAKGWDPTESYDPELDEEDTVADYLKRGGKITKLKPRAARGSAKGKMTLKSKNPKGGGERGRRSEKKMHGEDYEVEEGFLSGESKHRALMKSYDRRRKKADSVQLSPEMLKKAGERQRADLTKTVPAGQPFSATDAAYKRRQANKAKNEEYDLDEAATHKVGDTVIATEGPHKGIKHKVIHDHGNGKYNVQPVGLNVKQIKYRQGAATAHGKHLTPHSTNEETLGEILDNPDAKRRYLEKSKQSLSRTQDDIKYGPTSTQQSQGTAVSDYVKLATRRRNRERGIKRVESEEYDIDEAEMSQAEIIRRRKDQKRELVRGKRKSGKTSDKMYDYELRKSEGKPVNVPKTKNESLEEVATNIAKRGSWQTGDAQVHHPAKAQFGRKSKSERLGREKGPSGKTPEKSWSKERGNYDDRGPKQKAHDSGVEAQRGTRAKKWSKISSDQLKRYRGRQHGGGPEGKPAKYSHTVGAAGKRASEGGHLESPKAEKQRRNAHPLRRGVKTKGATSTGKSPALTAHKAKNRASGNVDATRVGGATRGGQYPSRGTRYEEVEELVLDQLLLDSILAEAGLDAVDKKALKKKFKNREDQDIDNDGDEDESDEYLHNRRQTVSKKIGKKKGEKIEINPEIKEAIRKLIHSTL